MHTNDPIQSCMINYCINLRPHISVLFLLTNLISVAFIGLKQLALDKKHL
jgi:hypothetical protein